MASATEPSRGIHVTPGNDSYYLEKREQREAIHRAQSQAAAREAEARRRAAKKPADKPRKRTLAERKELEGIEEQIMEAEEAVATLEAKLNDPAFQSERFEEVPAVVAELETAKTEVTRLYARWEELESLPS